MKFKDKDLQKIYDFLWWDWDLIWIKSDIIKLNNIFKEKQKYNLQYQDLKLLETFLKNRLNDIDWIKREQIGLAEADMAIVRLKKYWIIDGSFYFLRENSPANQVENNIINRIIKIFGHK